MAAVTLQDLMNPLTKIQAATESSAALYNYYVRQQS